MRKRKLNIKEQEMFDRLLTDFLREYILTLPPEDYSSKNTPYLLESGELENFIKELPLAVFTRNREPDIVEMKRQAIITLRNKYELSFPKIAKILKYKEHTTPMSLYKKLCTGR